jgi:hypothetical protein
VGWIRSRWILGNQEIRGQQRQPHQFPASVADMVVNTELARRQEFDFLNSAGIFDFGTCLDFSLDFHRQFSGHWTSGPALMSVCVSMLLLRERSA